VATIQKKVIKGNAYWYLIESRRVNGKPRPIVLAYLGSTDKLIARLGFAPVDRHDQSSESKLKCFAYGAVAALLQAAQDIGLEEILTRHFPIQQRGGLSVARTLLVASIYRALRPGSKRAFAAWAKDTALPVLLSFNPRQLTAQRFWDQMNVVDVDALQAAEAEVAQRVVGQLKVPLDLLLYDATNFYTWISHHNRRNALCRYGHNKQKRTDLRQFNLALLCSRDELVPVLSKVYAGQIPDAKSFPLVISEIRTRLAALNAGLAKPITVVMDKGNYSQEIQLALATAELDWVAAMNPMMIPGTERVRKGYFRPVIVDDQPILAWHRAKRLWGQEGQLIIYYSEKAQYSNRYWLDEKLAEMVQFLIKVNGGQRHLGPLQREVNERLKKHDVGKVLKVELTREANRIQATWTRNEKMYRYLTEECYGREILFTSRLDLSSGQAIKCHHDLGRIENVFRSMKDELHLSVIPEYHWTDQKIRVHVFTCLLGLILTGLVHRKTKDKGLDISANRMMDELKQIHEITIVDRDPKGRLRVRRKIEEMDDDRRRIAEAVGIS